MGDKKHNLYLVLEGIVYSLDETKEAENDPFDNTRYQVKLATRDLHAWLSNDSDWILVSAPTATNALNLAAYNDANYTRETILRQKHQSLQQYRSILLFGGTGYRPKFVANLIEKAAELGDLHALDLVGEYSPWIYNWRKNWEVMS